MTDNLTVIVPYFNGGATIGRLLDSLPTGLPVVVVDDHSDEPLISIQGPRWFNARHIRAAAKGYFTGAVNRGIEATTGDVLILNQDVWFEEENWLNKLDTLRQEYDLIGDPVRGHPAWPAGYIQGTFMYISRKVIDAIGLLNEADYPLWGSTCEYQLRAARHGFKAYMWSDINSWMTHQDRPRGGYGSAITEALATEPARKAEFIRTPPAVSVIVPCYNYGRYLPDCIHSLIGGQTSLGSMPGQTFQSFEVIIVDDASQDDTPQIAAQLADDWKAIRYIRLNQNQGTPGALNAGIEAAHGKYITILSADDMREPWSLDALYRVCEADPHAVAYDNMRIFSFGQRLMPVWKKTPDYDFERLLTKNHMHAGIMFPKAAWVAAGGYPLAMQYGREDWAFNVGIGLQGYCGVPINDPGYLYRREKQNRTTRNDGPAWQDRFMMQMQGLYPDVYAGWRPPMCCGKETKVPTNGLKASNGNGVMMMAQSQSLTGADGLTLIEYIGRNAGDETWQPNPQRRYTFGGVRRMGYVDRKDVEWFLGRRDTKGALFRLAPTPGPLQLSQPEAERINPGAAQAAVTKVLPVDAVVVAIAPVFALDPADYSIRQLKELDLSADEWKLMLEKEEAGQERKSAIAYMEMMIE